MSVLNLLQLILICGLCVFGIWELWRTRTRSQRSVIWYVALISLLLMLLSQVAALLVEHNAYLQQMFLLSNILLVGLVGVGTGRIRRGMFALNKQLEQKRKVEAELALNRERLQQLVSQRTEALRGEILQRKTLQDDLARYSRALEKDLSAAARAQSAMQQVLPSLAYLDLAAQSFARDQVNGDMYFARERNDGGVDILVGDAMGHGAAAGFVTVLTRTALSILSQQYSPGQLLEQLNRLMLEQNSGVYLTAVLARIDAQGQCCVAHAGHPPAMLIKPDGSVQQIPASGFALGMFELDEVDFGIEEHHIQLEAGERLLLYSDGLTELRNKADEVFGSERLVAAVRPGEGLALEETLTHTLESAYDFCGSRAVDDDITLLVMEYKQPS